MSTDSPPEVTVPELLDWLEGRLSPDRRRAVEEAVATGDRGILELVRWYRTFRTEAARLPLVAPPPLIRQRLRALAATRRGELPPLVRLSAHPVLDTRRTLPAGVRGPASTDTSRYQLTFAAAGLVVVLDVVPDGPSTVTIRGQVIPQLETPPVFEATAQGADGVVSTILGDELGGFRLSGVPVESRSLVVTNDAVEVEMRVNLSSELS
jgi:anti-sigma factor RsiW